MYQTVINGRQHQKAGKSGRHLLDADRACTKGGSQSPVVWTVHIAYCIYLAHYVARQLRNGAPLDARLPPPVFQGLQGVGMWRNVAECGGTLLQESGQRA